MVVVVVVVSRGRVWSLLKMGHRLRLHSRFDCDITPVFPPADSALIIVQTTSLKVSVVHGMALASFESCAGLQGLGSSQKVSPVALSLKPIKGTHSNTTVQGQIHRGEDARTRRDFRSF